MKELPFVKMEGAGNDYLYLDAFRAAIPADLPELARRMSDRHFGVGGDGLIVIAPSEQGDARMIMYNADGSRAEMCGNGIRCLARYLIEEGRVPGPVLSIETDAGIRTVEVMRDVGGRIGEVRVDMGRPEPGRTSLRQTLEVDGLRFEASSVSMGNPHCVVRVEGVDAFAVERVGPRIASHPRFPEGTNVEFVEVRDSVHVRQRTWERGTGETLACGTGACAVVVACHLNGWTERRVGVELRGGHLRVEWREDGHVHLIGPAREVFRGAWPMS